MQLWLYLCGIVNALEAVFNGATRGIVFPLPNWLRAFEHVRFLRE
jgi:hypothetical protein